MTLALITPVSTGGMRVLGKLNPSFHLTQISVADNAPAIFLRKDARAGICSEIVSAVMSPPPASVLVFPSCAHVRKSSHAWFLTGTTWSQCRTHTKVWSDPS